MTNVMSSWMTSATEGLLNLGHCSTKTNINLKQAQGVSFCFSLNLFLVHRARSPGALLEHMSAGCFCPSGTFRAGNHSDICLSECPCE